jgi:hypothetical protein
MKTKTCLQTVILLTLIGLLFPTTSFATSWKKFTPSDVVNRAEVIILGTYDFAKSDGKMTSNGLWTPYKFNVEKYIRSSGNDTVNVGINYADISWAKELQGKGGKFLLLLVKDSQDSNLLVPVGGPNGMIEFLDGKIQNQSSADAVIYSDLLKSLEPKSNVIPGNEITPPIEFHWYWVPSGLFVLGILFFLYWKLSREKGFKS